MTNRDLNSRLCPACLGPGKSIVGGSSFECYLCKGAGHIFARKFCFACKGLGVQEYAGLYSLCLYCNPAIPNQIPGKEPDYTKLPPPLDWSWWDNR